jgi:hypothetical protein
VDDNPVCLMANKAILSELFNVQCDTFDSGEALMERLDKKPYPAY